jgi:phage FluMu protein Com
MDDAMNEIRCAGCNKKLAMAEYSRLEIKCHRCKALNLLKAEPGKVSGSQSPQPERPERHSEQSNEWTQENATHPRELVRRNRGL